MGENGSNGSTNGGTRPAAAHPLPSGISTPSSDAIVYHGDLLEGEHAPSEVLELAAACVRFVTTSVKLEPDFTSDTMPLIDHYVRESRKALEETPQALALTAHAIGAYIGEVVRRTHRCWWRVDGVDPGAWRLEMATVQLAFYPVQMAYTCLLQESDEQAFSGFEMLEKDRDLAVARLELLPPVSDIDYHLPSTRLEVLEVLVDHLTAHHAQGPFGSRTLRPEDYE